MLRTVFSASKKLAGVARSVSTSSLLTPIPTKISHPSLILLPRLVPSSGTTLRVPRIPILNDPPPVVQSLIIERPRLGEGGEVTTPSIGPAVVDPSRIIEKQAARLIVIRRRKMRRHKLKKLRKKMKFVYAKFRLRREIQKEKVFQADIVAQLKTAEKFDAVGYASDKIKRFNEVPTPKLWRGKRLPEFVILDLIKKRKEKCKRIAEDAERRKTMKHYVSDYKV